MTNRIGGDFNLDAVEAFRAAYAQQLVTPDQDEVANNSGLTTNVVGNTSPWHDHVGLWRYPSGKGPDDDLKVAFNPQEYLSEEVLESSEEDDELDEALAQMSDEELDNLIEELLGSDGGSEDEEAG